MQKGLKLNLKGWFSSLKDSATRQIGWNSEQKGWNLNLKGWFSNLKGSTVKQFGWNSRQKGWFFNLHRILKRENRVDVSGFYVCRIELRFL